MSLRQPTEELRSFVWARLLCRCHDYASGSYDASREKAEQQASVCRLDCVGARCASLHHPPLEGQEHHGPMVMHRSGPGRASYMEL